MQENKIEGIIWPNEEMKKQKKPSSEEICIKDEIRETITPDKVEEVTEDKNAQIRKALTDRIKQHLKNMNNTKNRPQTLGYYDTLISLGLNQYSFSISKENHEFRDSKIIGTFCTFIPDELIYAAGAIPIRLDAGLHETVATAEQILPANLCACIKSFLGFRMLHISMWGETKVDLAIVPTVCDGKKKMAELLSDYIPTWLLQVPHTTTSLHAREFWHREIKILKEKLEQFTGNKITYNRLKKAITIQNQKRDVIRQLYEISKNNKLNLIWGRDLLMVATTSHWDDPIRWTEQTKKLCLELEERMRNNVYVSNNKAPRIMLVGCPIIMPNWKIPDILETSGGIIVGDELCSGSRGVWYLVEEDCGSVSEMLDAIADRYLMCECPCFIPNNSRIERILKFVKEWNIDGIVYYQLLFCHTLNVESRRVSEALEKIGVSMLKIETDYSEEDVEQIRTRVEAFLEMVSKTKGR